MRGFEGVEPWTPEVARQRLSEFEASRLCAAGYAARLGVSRQRVSYGWARLRREAAEARPRFVELAVRERAPPPAALKVRFPSGHAVIVPAGTATLAEVLAPEERLELRNDRSRRALDLLWVWTRKVGARVRPRSTLGKALRTLANQRTALLRFLEDGRLPVDNTSVEREMKPIILGRKNWLFAGNFRGAERLADGITVIATARLHGLHPVDYLRWLLPQLARREGSEAAAADQLMPEHFRAFLDRQQGQHSEIAAHEGQ